VLVASTGVIGVALPIEKSEAVSRSRWPRSPSTRGGGRARDHDDRSVSQGSGVRSIGGRGAAIGGMAKGSGMIEPMMATMLAFVTTDAAVPKPLLDRALTEVGRTTRSTPSPSTASARPTTA
jgi:glutamate N-acetyltransferase/amino-acid N-acetyltransferase